MSTRHRIDKFSVPAAHLDDLLAAVAATHAVLRAQPGFVRDLVARQTGGPGRFNVVTHVEWSDTADIETITAAVRRDQQSRGFDPAAALAGWGAEADIGWYSIA